MSIRFPIKILNLQGKIRKFPSNYSLAFAECSWKKRAVKNSSVMNSFMLNGKEHRHAQTKSIEAGSVIRVFTIEGDNNPLTR